jgi:hypothetical protein
LKRPLITVTPASIDDAATILAEVALSAGTSVFSWARRWMTVGAASVAGAIAG